MGRACQIERQIRHKKQVWLSNTGRPNQWQSASTLAGIWCCIL